MGVIDDVRRDREDLARVLKKHAGIRRVVEDLYPDSAHFIYELLQNAEDTRATEARFVLSPDRLMFEHNGRPFEARDIEAITDIGEGTKAEDTDTIGRFGVGFKAVFAYSETPMIWSPTFSFKITDLVLPHQLAADSTTGKKTRFVFPFNNPKKNPVSAYAEILAGLKELAETTLLFLRHLEAIRWDSSDALSSEVLRVQHSTNHVEVLRQIAGRSTSAHFLKFDEGVEGLPKQSVSVAFALDFLPNSTRFEATRPLSDQLRIVPAIPGRVAVFFPAEKETSGLRFHLHAPFVPELSRASIKETPANAPLFAQIGRLASASLHAVRDLNLLTADCLAVLPNGQDDLAPRYEGIRAAIIAEMNNAALTPTYSKGHAPARLLLQAKASLKELLTEGDIEYLADYDDVPPQWAIGTAQKNSNIDRFLTSLAITQWDVDELVLVLRKRASKGPCYVPPQWITGPDADFMAWLANQTPGWHQELYSLLYSDYIMSGGSQASQRSRELSALKIIRLTDGTYSSGGDCYFPGESNEYDEVLPRVDAGVFSAGRKKVQQENARQFLEAVGVRSVGEAEQIAAILIQRYTEVAEAPSERTYRQDLKRFVGMVETDPEQAEQFADSFVLQGADGNWYRPSSAFIDQPLLDSGLTHYYDGLGAAATRVPLAAAYADRGVPLKRLLPFFEKIGVQARLTIQPTSCWKNPAVAILARAAPGARSSLSVDRDFTIVGLIDVLKRPTEDLSRLVWRTVVEHTDADWTTAKYRNNASYPIRTAPSQLAAILASSNWLPQGTRGFVSPAQASPELLPAGFSFDPKWPWLQAIGFGRDDETRLKRELQAGDVAKELGFADRESLERAQRFAALPFQDQVRMLSELERRAPVDLPDHEPSNRNRRAERVRAQAQSATERRTEQRTRSVPVGVDGVKQQAAEYLREQYTTSDGEMICQICKGPLPFKLPDGRAYFEKVELFEELRKHHRENYVALCPNHAAMYQHANDSRATLRHDLLQMTGNTLSLTLGQEECAIYFTHTHLFDLVEVIKIDQAPTDEAEGRHEEVDGSITDKLSS